MRFYPTEIRSKFLCFFLISIVLNLGCSKDSDLLLDAVIDDDPVTAIQEGEKNTPQATESEEEPVAEEEMTEESQRILESRTTSFSPTNDAHFQSGKGYNQSIIRLDEGNRTSYLMFDLSPINAIAGDITKVTLQFTIDSDNGSGNINVSKANSSNWSEDDLSDGNIPEVEVQVGSIIKEYKLGETELIDLNAAELLPEISTLILDHKNGNDLAFASKEHPSKIGPKLVVTYDVDEGKEEIIVPEEEEDTNDETTGGDTTEEETTGEGTTQEDSTQEDTTQEETSEEEQASTNEEPIAVADATPSSGGAPLAVTFSGSNSFDDTAITTYAWDFKDGATASTSNPKHTYTEEGIYEAILTVTDAEGLTSSDIVTITVSDTPNEAPKATVSATPVSGEAPLEVTFKGSASTDDHAISSYSWDLKDGSKTNIADFKYTYDEPGTYVAELTVTDENGLTDKETITIEVREPANDAPVAKTAANTTLGAAPLSVQFTGSNSTDDKEVTEYAWDFKDGGNSTTPNPSYTFTDAGTYVVELTVSDQEGLTHKNTITITVTQPAAENEAPVAKVFANRTSGEAPLAVQFTGNQSTDDEAITSYFWDFKDGNTSTNSNPAHTFNAAGSYNVELTVQDADGANDTAAITINVTNPVVSNAPPGFYVATNGNSSNNGQSPSSPWSLEYAMQVAKAGDVVYVKAGNYGNKQLVPQWSGQSGNPIKFIGYTNTPGDIQSNQSSTFNHGDAINPNKMPSLRGASFLTGKALQIHQQYFEIHNFQISNYLIGINATGNFLKLKNVIISDIGQQNNNSIQGGRGMQISGDYSVIENCFVLNSNGEAINIKGANNCTVKNTKVYSDNISNMTGYYIAITFGGRNNIVEGCTIYRDPRGDSSHAPHQGHGYVMKDQASNNIMRNSKAYNTGIEVNFSGVYSNTFDNIDIFGSYSSYRSQYSSNITVNNGAHDNTFKNINIKNTRYAVAFIDYNDGFTGSGGDLNQGGNNNTFTNISVDGANNVLFFNSKEIGFGATSKNNKFYNSTFKNVNSVPFSTKQTTSGTLFDRCIFQNIPSNTMKELNGSTNTLPITFSSCTFTNVGFSPN